jgi:tetratricopeptide (TPR) repeat protein
VGDEQEALDVGLEALAIGEQANQPFTAAVAHETVAASLRRLLRLDEALEHGEHAIRTFRELGARWELASALGDRGAVYRVAGRLEEAERDLREAFLLCRDLQERALVTWTVAELARIHALLGDPTSARQVLAEPWVRRGDGDPGSVGALLSAESVVALAEQDRATARAKAEAAIEAETDGSGEALNARAALRWWAGRVFDPDAAGGQPLLDEARSTLERHHWLQALREPELAADLGG